MYVAFVHPWHTSFIVSGYPEFRWILRFRAQSDE
jgi:hypothetical protein